MKIKNPVMFALVIAYILLNAADMITSYFILPGESNVLFLLTKSTIPMLLLKIGLCVVLIAIYKKNSFPNDFLHYVTMLAVIMTFAVLGIAIYGNIQGMLHPQIVEEASRMTTGEKLKGYSLMLGFFYVIPSIMSILSFKFYQWSKKYM
jgi:hypothetical protein